MFNRYPISRGTERCLLLPNRGRMHTFALKILRSLDVSENYDARRLCYSLRGQLGSVMFVRSEDIPRLLVQGVGHMGLTGLDYAEEAGIEFNVVQALPAFEGRLTLQVRLDSPIHSLHDLPEPCRIVTQYPRISRCYFEKARRDRVQILPISGAAEAFVYRGLADASVDVDCTGDTARANEMRGVFSIGSTSAVVIKANHSPPLDEFDFDVCRLALAACAD